MTDSRAIGVFDSGLGGLTVLSALHEILPNEATVYLGDTARVPYGTKSAETVIRYSIENARILMEHAPLKMLVVACSTASSVALEALQKELDIPVVGVVLPSATAVMDERSRTVAILGTNATIKSQTYEKTLKQLGYKGDIFTQACPLFVPLVEEGLVEGKIAEQVAELYLSKIDASVDTLILGCTHYPLLLKTLNKVWAKPARWINSGMPTALWVKTELNKKKLLAETTNIPKHEYLVSDAPERFKELANYFLGNAEKVQNVGLVKLS